MICNRVKLLPAVNAEVCALGQVLLHQAVHVLVGTSLPRGVRVAEACANACALTGSPVHHHLATLLKRIGFAMARALTFCRLRASRGILSTRLPARIWRANGARAMPRALATVRRQTTPPAGAADRSSDPGGCERNQRSWRSGLVQELPEYIFN